MINIESVGETFSDDKLLNANRVAWDILHQLAAQFRPGMDETRLHEIYTEICLERNIEKNWHPPKLRIGKNTVRSFREPSDPELRLQEFDIFFIDIGPVIDGHEGDVGKTFIIGDSETQEFQEMKRAAEEVEIIWREVQNHWSVAGICGEDLYKFAMARAEHRGWTLNLVGASGHRIGDFPHAIHHRGSLRETNQKTTSNRWILEIQMRHPKLEFGAFYEDILRA